MDRRALLAIVLSFIVLFGSQWVFQQIGWLPKPQNPNVATAPTGPPAAPGQAELGTPEPTPAVPAPAGDVPALAPGAPGATGRWAEPPGADSILVVDHPLYTARFRARGAQLLSVALKDYKDGDSGRATLAADPAVALDLGDLSRPFGLAGAPYAWADSSDADGRIARLTFTARDTTGLLIEQTWRFVPDDYRMAWSVRMEGLPQALDLRHYRITLRSWPLLTERNAQEDLNNLAVVSKVGKDQKRNVANSLKKDAKVQEGSIRWLAVHSKYFLLGLVPEVAGVESRATLAPGTLPEAHDQVDGTVILPLPANGRMHSFMLYAGPLDYWRVDRLGMDLEPAHALGFNWFRPFSAALVWLMKMFHSLIHNWGVAIILLSLLAKVVTHPLQVTSMRSMRAMQRIQPDLERIRKKHEKDPQKMNTAIMELYRENKVNPLAGCLPMLIQMPFFLALYHVLGYSIELRQAGFVGWISDLSGPDLLFQLGPLPVRVLPILMFGSMLLQMRMTPTDPKQAMTMNLVNFVFLFLFYNLPSGLVLYWTVINLLTALQSWLIARSDPLPRAKKAA